MKATIMYFNQINDLFLFIIIMFIMSITSICYGQSDTLWHYNGGDTISTTKHVIINNALEVNGKITADSMHIHGMLQIGDSTFSFVNNVGFPAADHIRSTNGRIAFMGDNGTGGYNTNMNIGIGIVNPTARLHLNYNNTGTLKIGSGNRVIEGGNSAGNLNIESTNTLKI